MPLAFEMVMSDLIMLATVLRFESYEGQGIYYGRGPGYNAAREVTGGHPVPYEDEGIEEWWDNTSRQETSKYYCGFKDEAQMEYWFPKEKHDSIVSFNVRIRLSTNNRMQIVLKKFWIPKKYIVFGEKQVIFKREHAIYSRVLERFE